MRELGTSTLADAPAMDKLPQRLVNVKVADRESLAGALAVWDAVGKENAALQGRGRVLCAHPAPSPWSG